MTTPALVVGIVAMVCAGSVLRALAAPESLIALVLITAGWVMGTLWVAHRSTR